MRVALNEFRREHVAPAKARCDVLEDEIAKCEAEYGDLTQALAYNDRAAAAAQQRLEQLRRDRERWGARLSAVEARVNAQVHGMVEV